MPAKEKITLRGIEDKVDNEKYCTKNRKFAEGGKIQGGLLKGIGLK